MCGRRTSISHNTVLQKIQEIIIDFPKIVLFKLFAVRDMCVWTLNFISFLVWMLFGISIL